MAMKKIHMMVMMELWLHTLKLRGTVNGRETLFHKEIVQWGISFSPSSILVESGIT